MLHIKFPLFLTVRYAHSIILKCETALLSSEEEVHFDFSNCAFADPFAVTLLVGVMKGCQRRSHIVSYSSSPNKQLEAWLKVIGFYDWGKSSVGKSKYSGQQVELQHLTSLDPGYTDAVLSVLKNYINMSGGVRDSLHLSINELMTNAFDHSGTLEGCFVCAQAYKTRGNVNICLSDFGKGILKALSSSPKYNYLENSVQAIELAVQEGVSSREGRLAGLGLTHIQRFLEINNGEMHIISAEGWVHWNYRPDVGVKVRRKELKVPFEGTIVNIIARADGEGFYFLSTENQEEPIF